MLIFSSFIETKLFLFILFIYLFIIFFSICLRNNNTTTTFHNSYPPPPPPPPPSIFPPFPSILSLLNSASPSPQETIALPANAPYGRISINTEGFPEDIEVIESQPEEIFDQAAVDALARWKYRPKMESGQPVRQENLSVRIDFGKKK